MSHSKSSLIRPLIRHILICIRSGLANTAGALYSCQKGDEEREKTDRFLWQYAQIRHRGLFKGPVRGMPGGRQHIAEEMRGWWLMWKLMDAP